MVDLNPETVNTQRNIRISMSVSGMELIVKRNLHFLLVLVVAGAFSLLLSSCDAQAAQDDFVTEAGLAPMGITKILDSDFGGEVCSEDADDWRTSPVYNGVVVVDRGATPNPASSTLVTIELRVLQLDRVRGSLTLRSFGNGNTFMFLDTILDASAPGIYVLQFNSALLQENGLHRVFIFDGVGELVSYGDIELVADQPQSC